MDTSFISDIKVEAGDDSNVTISGEIPFTLLETERQAAVAALGKNIKIDGFREGKVPEAMIVERIGEMALLNEMAERALGKAYPQILKEKEVKAIGYPSIQVTKLAKDNPLGFTATVAVMPEITLPDYKAIAADINKDKASVDVTDEDLQKQIEDIMRQKIAYERLQEKAAAKAEAEAAKPDVTDATELPTPESEAAKAAEAEEENFDPSKIELPELTDDFVKTLGQPGQFETVDDFKAKLREHLAIEKEREVTAAHRAKITDAIGDKTEMKLPQVLIDSELNQMFAQMEEDLGRSNLKMEDYLTHIKKTKEDLEKEWTPSAEKRAQLQLILNEIAEKEAITPDKEQLESQTKQLMEQYKDADETRVKVYVASVMQNEAVMKMLETA